jgi:DsbC/DsbD-like thiol-disulfide interchange protein
MAPMARVFALLLALALAGPAFAQSPASAVVQTDNVRAELVADVSAVKAGEPFWVGLRQTIRPKWHTYWKNPGESGLPTEITWALPPGAKADPIVWPAPTLFDVGGITNYGFKDQAMLLVRITPPADLAGPLKLAAEANWLVCEDVCIPEDGKFELTLPSAAAVAPAPPEIRALFEQARRTIPTESPWPARYGISKAGDPTLVVEAKGLKPETISNVYFFPAEWGPVATMARQNARVDASGIHIPLRRGDAKVAMPTTLMGTLVLTEKTADGSVRQAFDVSAKLDPSFVPAGGSASLAGASGAENLSLMQAHLRAAMTGETGSPTQRASWSPSPRWQRS